MNDYLEILYQFVGSSILGVSIIFGYKYLVFTIILIGLGIFIYRGNKAHNKNENEK